MTAHTWPGYRWPHLFKLTAALLAEPHWPSTDRWLAERFREHPAYGRRDRAFYADAFFRLCRQAAVPAFLARRYRGEAVILDAAAVWTTLRTLAPAEIWAWLVLLDGADDALPREIDDGAERRRWLEGLDKADRATLDHLAAGWLPAWDAWLAERARASDWSTATRDDWLALQNRRPPLWVRLVAGREDQTRAALAEAGFRFLDSEGRSLALAGDPGLTRSTAWQAGGLDIQDRASQAVVEAVAARPGERLWDACAGAGGKALALAEAVDPDGTVLATDIRPAALAETEKRARRLALGNLSVAELDATTALPDSAPFDVVLVDAPCSGSGTWRRSPDARWRLTDARLTDLTALQDRILEKAASAVRPGGRLVYATCSWLVAENEARVDAFLARHPAFGLVDQRLVGAPAEDADTLFVAVLARRP